MAVRMTETIEQLRDNVLEYQKVVREHPEYVYPGRVPDWYYIPALDMVGPSKFIGYAGMKGKRYSDGWSLYGGTTENHLASKEWFVELTPRDPEYATAERLADKLCPSRRHRRGARFRILKDEYDKEVRRLNRKASGHRGDSHRVTAEGEMRQTPGKRRYWVVSPRVDGIERNVENWKKEIIGRRSAMLGYPRDYVKGRNWMGPKFAGEGDPSVQPGDVVLIARSNNLAADIIGFGVVKGRVRVRRFTSLWDQDVQLRQLAPFRERAEAPENVPLLEVLQHIWPFVQLYPETDPDASKVCRWMDRLLRLDGGETGSSRTASKADGKHPKVIRTTGLPKSKDYGYQYKTKAAIKRAQKVEAKLLTRYEQWLGKKDRYLESLTYNLTYNKIRCDRWEEEAESLIEAKGSTSREDIRMAVGQLLDYAFQGRGLCKRPNKAILLPSRPDDDRIGWLEPLGIKVIWHEKGSFVDNANGRFV